MRYLTKPFQPASSETGYAILVSIMFLMLFTLAAAFAIQSGYQQRDVSESTTGSRMRDYYRARAGMVDAMERIRKNELLNWPGASKGGNDFNKATWPSNPGVSYYIDIDANTVSLTQTAGSDVKVTITKQDPATGLRTITCTSIGD